MYDKKRLQMENPSSMTYIEKLEIEGKQKNALPHYNKDEKELEQEYLNSIFSSIYKSDKIYKTNDFPIKLKNLNHWGELSYPFEDFLLEKRNSGVFLYPKELRGKLDDIDRKCSSIHNEIKYYQTSSNFLEDNTFAILFPLMYLLVLILILSGTWIGGLLSYIAFYVLFILDYVIFHEATIEYYFYVQEEPSIKKKILYLLIPIIPFSKIAARYFGKSYIKKLKRDLDSCIETTSFSRESIREYIK